jgi:exodeoxyribonuclease V alpha subunit
MAQIEGTIERITYQNEDNNFTVARLAQPGKEYLTTVVGYLPLVNVGETLRVTGEWVSHPDYGTQFKVSSFEIVIPATINGIQNYIGSGLIKGIGPKLAKKLVDAFGTKTLEIIETQPELLKQVEGIGEKKAESIYQSFVEHKEIQDVMVFLQGYGISPIYAVKIYKEYGANTFDYIKQNPYRLAEDIFGIGFKTADSIAQKLGIEPSSFYRVISGLKYILGRFASEGHTYVPIEKLRLEAEEALAVGPELIDKCIEDLSNNGEIFLEVFDDGEKAVYLAPFYYAERGAAERFYRLAAMPYPKFYVSPAEISELERETGVRLAPGQKEAINKVLENGILVLTGGPGTGKTTTLKSIISLLEKHGQKVALAAPTGRAARRMSEATDREAKTLHRLLEYSPYEGQSMRFGRDEDRPIEADVIIVDETSMVDILLVYHLLKAIKPGTRVVFVGDVDQLPSVGAGNVLNSLIQSGCIEVVELKQIFRQSSDSLIAVNAHMINNGEFPCLNKGRDFFMDVKDSPEEVLHTILSLCSERLPKFNGFDPINDIQVLTPMKRTPIGVHHLNQQLQALLNPPSAEKEERRYGAITFREGDKVMQIKNNYNKEVFNGDIGRIIHIDNENNELIIRFPEVSGNRDVTYEGHELDELTLSYAVSVHKSQGSEYPVIVMPVTTQHYMMLQRNLIYTAVTRARKMVVLVGSKKALGIAINNCRVSQRYTRLGYRINKMFNDTLKVLGRLREDMAGDS